MSKEFEIIISKLNNLEKDNKEQKEFQKIVLKQLDEQQKFNKEILKKYDTLERRVITIKTDLKDFRKETAKRFNETDNRFNTLERTVTIIEDEVKNNIPALFNADLTRQQKESSLQSEVDHLR